MLRKDAHFYLFRGISRVYGSFSALMTPIFWSHINLVSVLPCGVSDSVRQCFAVCSVCVGMWTLEWEAEWWCRRMHTHICRCWKGRQARLYAACAPSRTQSTSRVSRDIGASTWDYNRRLMNYYSYSLDFIWTLWRQSTLAAPLHWACAREYCAHICWQ